MNILYPTSVSVHVWAGPPGFWCMGVHMCVRGSVWQQLHQVWVRAETLSINWAGVGGLQNDRVLSTTPACSTALPSRLSRIGAWGAVKLHCYPCACVCACMYVSVSQDRSQHAKRRWVNKCCLRTYTQSGTEKCVSYLPIDFCLTFLFLSPLHALSLFIPMARHGGQKPRRAVGREARLFASKKHWKEADINSTVLSCRPSLLLPYNHRLLCTWAASVIWGHLFFWCGPCTTQSTVSEFTEGQFSNPDFPYSTVLSAVSWAETLIKQSLCAASLKNSTADCNLAGVSMMEDGLFWACCGLVAK